MSHRLIRLFVLVLAALLVSGLTAGCEVAAVKKAERKYEPIPMVRAEQIDVPADWPKEIPNYPNAELLEVSQTPVGRILTYKTTDTADRIFEWYYDTLEAAKWNMKGPTLDVAQNLAIIKSELGPLSFLLDTRRRKNEKGETEGSTIKIITPAPRLGGP